MNLIPKRQEPKYKFSRPEREIMRALWRSKMPMSYMEIWKTCGMKRRHVQKAMSSLLKKGALIEVEKGKYDNTIRYSDYKNYIKSGKRNKKTVFLSSKQSAQVREEKKNEPAEAEHAIPARDRRARGEKTSPRRQTKRTRAKDAMARRRGVKRTKPRFSFSLLTLVFALTFCFAAYGAADELLTARKEKNAFAELTAIVAEGSTASMPRASLEPQRLDEARTGAERQPEPEETIERAPLPQYLPLYTMNPDFFGWLSIEGTLVDYPVMYTPDRPEYYLNRAFDESYSVSGVPFVDSRCPEQGNFYLIYGHHMQNKTMFGQIPYYSDADYRDKHPVICFDTLYEHREYTVIAALLSHVYRDEEQGVFRYYDYADLTDPQMFKEFVRQVKAYALYDTGIDADYGDELLMLSTCNYHTADGRFAVVAKRIA